MALRQLADFFAYVGKRAFDICGIIFRQRIVQVPRLVEFAQHPPIINDVAVVLALCQPIHAGDCLQHVCSLSGLSIYSTVLRGSSKPVSNLSTTIMISMPCALANDLIISVLYFSSLPYRAIIFVQEVDGQIIGVADGVTSRTDMRLAAVVASTASRKIIKRRGSHRGQTPNNCQYQSHPT